MKMEVSFSDLFSASLTKMLKNKYRVCFLYCQLSQKDVYYNRMSKCA